MKLRHAVLAVSVAAALSACSSTASTTPAQLSETTAVVVASTSAEVSSSAPSAESSALTQLCETHCAALQSVSDLPACANGAACTDQALTAGKVVLAFLKDAKAQGVDLADYAAVQAAAMLYSTSMDGFFQNGKCLSFEPDGSKTALDCASEVFIAKTSAGTIATTLRTAAVTA